VHAERACKSEDLPTSLAVRRPLGLCGEYAPCLRGKGAWVRKLSDQRGLDGPLPRPPFHLSHTIHNLAPGAGPLALEERR